MGLDGRKMWRVAAVVSLLVLRGASGTQWYESPGGAPPGLSPGGPTSQEVSARLASTSLAALPLASCVEMVGVAINDTVLVLLVWAVAKWATVCELAVNTGDVDAFIVFQQLRRGRVREGAASPWAVLVRLGTLRLETGVLKETHFGRGQKKQGNISSRLKNHLTFSKEKAAFAFEKAAILLEGIL